MRQARFHLLLTVGAVFLILMLAGCPSSQGPTSFTLSGAFYKTGIADGTKAYAKLVALGGAEADPALYWTSATFSGESADYSMPSVAAGSYTLYAFIDTDGNAAGDSTSLPDAGDWGLSDDLTIDSDLYSAYLEMTWTLL